MRSPFVSHGVINLAEQFCILKCIFRFFNLFFNKRRRLRMSEIHINKTQTFKVSSTPFIDMH